MSFYKSRHYFRFFICVSFVLSHYAEATTTPATTTPATTTPATTTPATTTPATTTPATTTPATTTSATTTPATTTPATTTPATTTPATTTCWAATSWVNSTCIKCSAPQQSQCPSSQWTPCFPTEEECKENGQDDAPTPCWAATSWVEDAKCEECSSPQQDQCPDFGWTRCFPTEKECYNISDDNPPPTCWAAKSWLNSTCIQCSAPVQDQCPGSGWTRCYQAEKDCIDASSGGSNCKNTCPSNTLGLKRPEFKGPNCYNEEYGKQFGPNWVPTGKTRFEHYVKNPTELYKMLQTTGDNLPWLQNKYQSAWNLDGSNAAAAVYENIVCAIEIITSSNKTFTSPRPAVPGNNITDFANNGDPQVDLREISAFISQSWKETGRMQTWEETPSTGYADCTVYPCGKSLYYQGRGPVQLSWNYNYGPFSEWMFGDKFVLLDDPDKIDPEGPMGYIANFWFWFTPRDFTSGFPISGRLRMRDAIVHWTDGKINDIYRDGKDYDSIAGLGLSTNVVNGGVECSPGSDSPLWRIMYFLTAAARLGMELPDMNDEVKCKADKFCNGLFSGCSASSMGATCNPVTNYCGPTYVQGWLGKLCTQR